MNARTYIGILRNHIYTNSLYVTRDMLTAKKLTIIDEGYNKKHGIGDDKQALERIRNDELMEANLKPILESFISYLPNEVRDKFSKTTFAVMNTRKAEAFAVKLMDDDYVVILSYRMCKIFHFYTQTKVTMWYSDKSAIDSISKDMIEKIVESFTKEIVLFPKHAEQINEQRFEHAMMAMLECVSMELFVILHEYAHIYLGHLDRDKSFSYEEKLVMELEADIQAIMWMHQVRNVCTNDNNLKSYLVSGTFASEALYVIGIMEGSRAEDEDTINNTHPSVIIRLLCILMICKENKEQIEGNYNILFEAQVMVIKSALKSLLDASDTEIDEMVLEYERFLADKDNSANLEDN